MARALFLQGVPACQPYEWYPSQMESLEQLVLEYETFACTVGPIACGATGVGILLLVVQLLCCPMLLVGRWGGQDVLFLLLATDDELDSALAGARALSATDGIKSTGASRQPPVGCASKTGAQYWTEADISPCASDDGNSANGSGSGQYLLPDVTPSKVKSACGVQAVGKPLSNFVDESNGALAVFAAARSTSSPPQSRQRRTWEAEVSPATLGRS